MEKSKVETNNAGRYVVCGACSVAVYIVLIKESTHMLITPIRKLIHTSFQASNQHRSGLAFHSGDSNLLAETVELTNKLA